MAHRPSALRFALVPLLATAACRPSDRGAGDPDGGPPPDAPAPTVSAHPCVGNRTDALWHDPPATFWVGCGSTANGRGLFVSDDGGATWTAPDETFATWRVDDLTRAADGRLYVAGRDTAGDRRVVALGDGGVETVWRATETVSFDVGAFAVAADGRALGASATGVEIVVRGGEGAAFESPDGWAADGLRHHLFDVAEHGGGFYAAGGRITDPPRVFVPPGDGEWWRLVPVTLDEDVRGELWGIAVAAAGRVVAAGVDHDRAVGVAWWSDGDPGSPDDWRGLDVSTLVEGRSWMRGVCARGDTYVVVGERQPLKTGGAVAIRSDDAGGTWRAVSVAEAPASIQRCVVLDGGAVALAGSEGWFAVTR